MTITARRVACHGKSALGALQPQDGSERLNLHRHASPRRPPQHRKKDEDFIYHAYTGRRVSPGQQRQRRQQQQQQQQQHQQQQQQQQQQQGPRHRRPLKGAIEGNTGVALPDSWGRGRGPSFAPKGVGPLLEPPRPPKGPTKPCWPTRTIGASALRYAGMFRGEKCVIDGAGPAGEIPTVSWPEHAEMETGDVVVTVEHCHSCHGHRMTTRHDAEVYLRQANAVRQLLVESLQETPIRLAVVLKKAMLRAKRLPRSGRGDGTTGGATSAAKQRRVGAFEVQVAARHPTRAHVLQVRVVHSKLACGRWPRLETDAYLPARVKATLAAWGFESNRPKVIRVDPDMDGKGADAETLSEQHRAPSRAHISWEFDNRKWLRWAATTPTPFRERIPDSGRSDPSNNSHTETRVRQGSTPYWGNEDIEQRTQQAGSRSTPEDAGTATIAKRDLGSALPSSRGGGSAPGATGNEATGKSSDGEGGDVGMGDGDGDGMSHATGGDGAAIDAAIACESEAEPPDRASKTAAIAKTAKSTAATRGPSTPRILRGSCSGGDDQRKEKERQPEESDVFQSVRPAASVSTSGGHIVATGLEGLIGDENDYDPETGGLTTRNDVGDVIDRIDTLPRSRRERRRGHEGKKDGDSPASACEGSSEPSCNGSPMRSARELQEHSNQSSSVGKSQCATGQTLQGAPQAPPGCGGAQDDREGGGNRASSQKLVGNPAIADSGEEHAASVGSISSSSSSASRESSKTGDRGCPKTEGERNSILETRATASVAHDGQERATSTSRKGAESRKPHRVNHTAEKEETFARPKVFTLGDHTRSRGHDAGDGGGDGGDDSDGSVDFLSDDDVVKPTNKAGTQESHEPGVTQRGNISEVESSSSNAYQETAGGGGGGGDPAFGDSRTVGETEHASAPGEDEYGSDFASQDDSSVEEVDEDSATHEGTPPSALPREDSGMGKSREEFQWSHVEEREKDEDEGEIEEEDEYGDDFDDEGGEFDSG